MLLQRKKQWEGTFRLLTSDFVMSLSRRISRDIFSAELMRKTMIDCAKKWKYNTVLEKSKRLNCALQYTTGIQYHLWWGTYSVLMKTGKKWPKNLHHILVKDLIVSDYFYMWYFPKSITWGRAIKQLSCGRQTHSLLLRLGFKSLFLK